MAALPCRRLGIWDSGTLGCSGEICGDRRRRVCLTVGSGDGRRMCRGASSGSFFCFRPLQFVACVGPSDDQGDGPVRVHPATTFDFIVIRIASVLTGKTKESTRYALLLASRPPSTNTSLFCFPTLRASIMFRFRGAMSRVYAASSLARTSPAAYRFNVRAQTAGFRNFSSTAQAKSSEDNDSESVSAVAKSIDRRVMTLSCGLA